MLTQEKERRVYGENSLEVGKEYRTIANIYLVKHDFKQADTNYKKAMKIFHDLGDQRLAREVKVKIASLQIQQRQWHIWLVLNDIVNQLNLVFLYAGGLNTLDVSFLFWVEFDLTREGLCSGNISFTCWILIKLVLVFVSTMLDFFGLSLNYRETLPINF